MTKEMIKETVNKESSPVKPNLKFMREKDREMVRGIFRYYEIPGGIMEFCYKAYKEDPVENYSFTDGQIVNIPLGVAKHLNKNGRVNVYDYNVDTDGKTGLKISSKTPRFGFQSLEFVDIDELNNQNPGLVTVEYAPSGF